MKKELYQAFLEIAVKYLEKENKKSLETILSKMDDDGKENINIFSLATEIIKDENNKYLESLNKPEPMSTPNSNPAIWDLVEHDIKERDELGLFKYKTRLQGFNGRDALKDAYQEALDLSVYLRQAIFERDGR